MMVGVQETLNSRCGGWLVIRGDLPGASRPSPSAGASPPSVKSFEGASSTKIVLRRREARAVSVVAAEAEGKRRAPGGRQDIIILK